MSEQQEIHVKLYFLNLKGAVKEIRRTALHLKPNWEHWPTVYRMVSNMFSLAEATMTYEDPEKDKVCLESQLEWEECLRLGPYGVCTPLRIHVKKRWSQTKNKGAVELEPTHFYHSCGAPVSGDLEHFKALVPSIVKRYLSLEDPQSLPDWLMPAAKWLQMDSGDTDLDVDINVLATCMSGRALALMDDREYRAALDLLLEAQILSPSATTLYNIACCQALMGNPEEAMTSLTSAVDLGYANFPHMLQDEDLASLRGHEGFQKLAAAAGPGAESSTSAAHDDAQSSDTASVEVVPEVEGPVSPVEVPGPQQDAGQPPASDPQDPQVRPLEVAAQATRTLAETVAQVVTGVVQQVQQVSDRAAQPAPAPAQPEPQVSEEQQESLDKLRVMGFLDDDENLTCLRESNWSLTAAIEKLVS
jgi:tetratricopeptide (TPR) repeat protein|eukprot:CAMPEP_0174285388 /NCGR_PEP_ID=MMETSP0809-20121228/8546_1 /TAXON_ID=73025 ORGANISM="Eutreptiella gymnastica-like, Strain CCMP1594" /NCGR_SAMPLE_ID=MMETSP0809 /ASSEMBLY_ACC=CAM_ASM_000658 /LENGTH=416 /DNA_ID=CAMNT_0015381159 /DNA_START=53 /DNA_END=1303 /DNA_ORIENTATION=+